MPSLAHQRCEVCHPGMPTLAPDQSAVLLAELDPGWRIEGGRLLRQLKFTDFASAFARASHIALVAEAEGHHPDLTVGWGSLEVSLTTHAAEGLTRNDFILAAKIDKLG